MEIKKGVSLYLLDVEVFKILENSKYKVKESCILCNTEKNYPLKEDVYVMSVNENKRIVSAILFFTMINIYGKLKP